MEIELKYDLDFELVKINYSDKMSNYYNIFTENRELFTENISNVDNIIFRLRLHMYKHFSICKKQYNTTYFRKLEKLFIEIEKLQNIYPEIFIWNFEFTFL